jgi:hypothetical protein
VGEVFECRKFAKINGKASDASVTHDTLHRCPANA